MDDQELDKLGSIAISTAVTGACRWCETRGFELRLTDEFLIYLRAQIKNAIPSALEDARQAYIEAQMADIAQATFLLSFEIAGAKAAAEYFEENHATPEKH